MKVLSINLWFENYKPKTLAQLKSFAHFGYETYAATIIEKNGQLSCEIYRTVFSDNAAPESSCVLEMTEATSFDREAFGTAYFSAFRYLFDYAAANDFDIVYIRRLMSKLYYASPHFKHLAGKCKIVYEIPTYPLDTNETFLYRLRDSLEMMLYSRIKKHITLTAVILRKDMQLPDKWISFHNGIDISNYSVTPVPQLKDEIHFIAVANMADWHRYDRMLHAMHKYHGKYSLHLTVVSPDNNTVANLRNLVYELGLSEQVEFAGKKELPEIRQLASSCHIGVGQLSYSSDCPPQINTLKTKDYCAMGLPFFTSCRDTSFEPDYPYAYVLNNMDDDLILEDIINWFEQIYTNPSYKQEMYDYAEKNLQFNNLVKQIISVTQNSQS